MFTNKEEQLKLPASISDILEPSPEGSISSYQNIKTRKILHYKTEAILF
jgi:hypothetical protein